MNNKKLKLFLLALLVAGFVGSGIFLFFSSTTSDISWDDALHSLMHNPRVQRVMGWMGLKEETVLKGEKIYWCPMHPQVRRDKPGLCPICNMQLVEMKEGKGKKEDVLVFTDRQVQQAGIRTTTVKRLNLSREIDTTGRVDVDERLLKTISSWVRGKSRIEKFYINFTGKTVKKGELLLSLYSPDLVTTQEEYLMLLKEDGSWANSLLKAAEVRIKRWGISESQLKEIRKNVRPIENFPIYSPMSGTVIKRLVTEGQYVTEGEPLLKLADLSRVWIYGDIYEYEFPYIKVGMPVEVSTEGVPGRTINGRIDFIAPVLQSESRTVRVRFEVENTEGLLRPGMYVRARIRIPQKKILAVPESAVLLTGRRAVVIISEGEGLMRPVEVRLGRKWFYPEDKKDEKDFSFLENEERYHEILSGLEEGQKVVVAGNFLVAAEAQFQGVLKKMLPPEEGTSEKTIMKLPGEIETSLANILESYEKIRNALSLDDTSSIKDTALHLAEDITTAGKGAEGEAAKLLTDMRTSAAGIAKGSNDIKEVRGNFSSLSQALISIINQYGIPEGLERNAFVCSMAEGYGGWLQPGKTVENPYLGQRMSTCGNPLSLKGSRIDP